MMKLWLAMTFEIVLFGIASSPKRQLPDPNASTSTPSTILSSIYKCLHLDMSPDPTSEKESIYVESQWCAATMSACNDASLPSCCCA